MTESRGRLSLLGLTVLAALSLVFAIVPSIAFGEGQDGWFDNWHEESSDVAEATAEGTDSVSEAEYPYEDLSAAELRAWNGSYNDWCAGSEGEWLLGVDVSEWNGHINWEMVRDSGVTYAIIKIGGSDDWEGNYVDGHFMENALECERLGIPYGVYFYSTAGNEHFARDEAEFVVKALEGLNPTLPVYIDLELEALSDPECKDILTDVGRTWCETIAANGYAPGVYSCASWWDYLLTDECFNNWSKWVAQYEDSCEVEDCHCWQYSMNGEIPGIDFPVDLNIWFA